MYSSLMADANERDADIVVGGIVLEYPDHSALSFNRLPAGYYDKTAIEKKIFPEILMKNGFHRFGIIPGVVVKVFKKEIIRKGLEHVPETLTIGEDVAITSYTMMYASGVSIVNQASYHYVQTEASMIRGYRESRFDDACSLYACITKLPRKSYQEQVGSYFACVLYGILSDCARNMDFTSKEFQIKLREYLANEISVGALRASNVSGFPFRDRVKVFLMKHKMIKTLSFLLKR